MALLVFAGLVGLSYFLVQRADRRRSLRRGQTSGQPLLTWSPPPWESRLDGAPRIHRSALREFAPVLLVLLLAVALTLLFTGQLLPVVLMGVACGLLGWGVFAALNQQARAPYNAARAQEDRVAGELRVLEDFTIPEDWTKKYR